MTTVDSYRNLVNAGMAEELASIVMHAIESRDSVRLDHIDQTLHDIRDDIKGLRTELHTAERWGVGLVVTLTVIQISVAISLIIFVVGRLP